MSKLQELMQQEVSRKDFLRYIGIALLSMVGVTSMLQNLTKTLGSSTTKSEKSGGGYGYSAYGR